MNISPPSSNSMLNLTNRISEGIVKLNQKDMSIIRQNLKARKEAIGEPEPECIRMEGNGRYNNRFGDTPFQPATQAVYTMLENETPEKKVIAISNANKLCKRGQLAQLRDKTAICPNHPGSCTANIAEDDIIGNEEKYAADCASQVNKDLTIRYFTADGDSKAFNGIQSVQTQKGEYLRDTRHMSNSLKRAIISKPFSASMFSGKTAAQRQSYKRRFAADVKSRCMTELQNALNYHKGDVKKVAKEIHAVLEAIIFCYRGYCGDQCRKFSYACNGLPHDKWHKNFLPRHFVIKMSARDEVMMEECLRPFLSPQVIPKMRLLTNTQAAEAFNRSHITMSRQLPGRVHTAAMMRNHGFSVSTLLRTGKFGAALTRGSRVLKYLKGRHTFDMRDKSRKRSILYKQRRSALRFRKYRLHENKSCPEYYSRDLADESFAGTSQDHTYPYRRK